MPEYPACYDPRRIGTLFHPDAEAIARAAIEARLPDSAEDGQRVHLLLIDMQVDFCHERGALYVPGALGDLRRVIEFIYRHAARITSITCSLDSHFPHQIFHAAWWINAAGQHPSPFTVITREAVEQSVWVPLWHPRWSRDYVYRLADAAKKELVIWPYHVLLGGPGHALDPELWSAVTWHALARNSPPTWWAKGMDPRTEHYSVIRPEIEPPRARDRGQRERFLGLLERYDATIIAGEAESHCVLETAEDLVEDLADRPELLRKVFILKDCTSPVHHPDMDFHAMALERFEDLAARGIRFATSGDVWSRF